MELSISQLLADSIQIVKSRFGPLLGMLALYFGITIVVSLGGGMLIGSVGVAGALAGSAETFGAGMIISLFLFYAAYLFVSAAQMGSLYAMASPLQRLEFGEAFATGWRSAPTMFAVFVIFLIACFLGFMVIGLFVGQGGPAMSLLLLSAILPVSIYLGCRLTTTFPVIAVERERNPLRAIIRSWSLTRRNVLAIFGTWLVYIVAAAFMLLVLFLPIMGSIRTFGADPAAAGFGALIFMFLGFIVAGVLLAMVSSAIASVIHAHLAGSTGEDLSETFA